MNAVIKKLFNISEQKHNKILLILIISLFCIYLGFLTIKIPMLLIIILSCSILTFFLAKSIKTKSINQLLWYMFIGLIVSSILGTFASSNTFIGKGGQFFLYRIILVFLPICTILFYKFNKIFKKNTSKIIHNLTIKNYLLFLVIWCFWLIISFLWTADLYELIRYNFLFICSIVLTISLPIVITNQNKLEIILYGLFAIFIFGIILGLFEFFGFDLPYSPLSYDSLLKDIPNAENFSKEALLKQYGWGITSFFGNQNNFATYIVFWLPFSILSIFYFNKNLYKISFLILSLISIILLISIASRSAIIAFIISLPLLSFYIIKRNKTNKKAYILLTSFFLILLFISLLGYWYVSNILSTIALEKLLAITSNSLGVGRMDLLLTSLKLFHQNPLYILIGFSAGNHNYYLQGLVIRDLLSLHNWWLEVFFDGGIFIFIGYNIFYFGILKNLYTIIVKSKNKFICFLSESLFISFICFFITSITCSSVLFFTQLWINWGLSLTLINLYRLKKIDSKG